MSRAMRLAGAAGVWIALVAGLWVASAPASLAQSNGQSATGGIRGQVADPTGAVVPGATVVVRSGAGDVAGKATSDDGGVYAVHGLTPGTYSVTVTAPGFAAYSVPGIAVSAGQMHNLNPALHIEMEKQEVQVQAENTTVDTSPDNNASAVVIKGSDLNALSDDPDELENELQALAGPAAGPNGGQIYIDGFTGGQLPPKSSIREIRVNQNPFSAQFDRLGYGRIEILTKPGTDKLHGDVESRGNVSSFNSKDPILGTTTEPPYSSWDLHGNVGGPITKNASYFVSVFARHQQYESVIDATDPTSLSAAGPLSTQSVATLTEAVNNPMSRLDVAPRIDWQLGKSNTLTARFDFYRATSTNGGLNGSALLLPTQAYNSDDMESALQLSDSVILNPHLVDDIRFQYRRVRSEQFAISSLPSYSVQGDFTGGGNNSQTSEDHQSDFELQDYISGAYGAHSLNFGGRARVYHDVNYTDGGSNGSYVFGSTTTTSSHTGETNPFAGCLDVGGPAATCQPSQYSYTEVNNPAARAVLFDVGLYYQDDWKVNPRFTFSYGLRWETQNRISDKDDWAPRVALAYAIGKSTGKHPPKTVLRVGYGWFYQRFTVANGGGSPTPYIVQAIHENLKNEIPYIRSSGIVFNPNQTTPITSSTAGSATGLDAPSYYTVDPHFRVANDMEAALGVDRQITKMMTANVTYLYTQGVHQYLTNNISAAGDFPLADAEAGIYPGTQINEPSLNDMQYQSSGFYREHQLMVSARAAYRSFSFFTNYSWSDAHGDTSGVGYVPSIASDPGADYGRTSFDVKNRFFVLGNFMLPWKISASPMLVANSGGPFNIVVGQDLTGNNQFNGRPTYAASCTEANTYQTPYGCLDAAPNGTGEKIIPYGLGTGPANVSLNMRLSKVIGIGPKLESGRGVGGGGFRGGPPGLGGGGFSGSRGGPGRLDQSVSRKYSLTFSAFGTNLFNHENLGTPNGVLTGRLFNQSQSLAGGFFSQQAAAGRMVNLQARFSF